MSLSYRCSSGTRGRFWSPGRLLTSLDRRSLAFQVQTLFTIDIGCEFVEYSKSRNGWYNTIWRLQCWNATGCWVKSSWTSATQFLLSHRLPLLRLCNGLPTVLHYMQELRKASQPGSKPFHYDNICCNYTPSSALLRTASRFPKCASSIAVSFRITMRFSGIDG